MYADNIISDDSTAVQMYLDGAINPIPVQIPKSKRGIGLRVQVNAPFSGVRMGFPTWGVAGTYCTLSVYRWDTDYRTTIAAEPLLDLPITDIQDCAFRDIPFGRQFAPGEYMFMVHSGGGPDGKLPGVWNFSSSVSCGQMYNNGAKMNGELQATSKNLTKISGR